MYYLLLPWLLLVIAIVRLTRQTRRPMAWSNYLDAGKPRAVNLGVKKKSYRLFLSFKSFLILVVLDFSPFIYYFGWTFFPF